MVGAFFIPFSDHDSTRLVISVEIGISDWSIFVSSYDSVFTARCIPAILPVECSFSHLDKLGRFG